MMFEYMPIECFKAIYVVDLCHSLCEVRLRAAQLTHSVAHAHPCVFFTFTPALHTRNLGYRAS